MLTNGLRDGHLTLHAFAYDLDGHNTMLGMKTVTVSNATSTKPFGAMTTPGAGQIVRGGLWNYGWALTPKSTPACTIGPSGVQVSIDSGPLMPVTYGAARTDIAAAFPGYTNTAGAGGAYYVDTTTMSDGLHQIGWYVVDSCGRAEGIGSRFFTVMNDDSAPGIGQEHTVSSQEVMPSAEPIVVRRDIDEQVLPGANGDRIVAIGQSERIEVQLPPSTAPYIGEQIVNGERRPLPLGSSLDAASGIFYWEPGPGFLGAQDLAFTAGEQGPVWVRVIVATSVQAVIDTTHAGPLPSSLIIEGWAIDQAAKAGSGIDAVHVWAYPAMGSPIFLGVADYGDDRPDIGALFGERFTNSAFSLAVDLPPGSYEIVVYPHSAVVGDFHGAQSVRVTVQ
jgi:hypothetical protein